MSAPGSSMRLDSSRWSMVREMPVIASRFRSDSPARSRACRMSSPSRTAIPFACGSYDSRLRTMDAQDFVPSSRNAEVIHRPLRREDRQRPPPLPRTKHCGSGGWKPLSAGPTQTSPKDPRASAGPLGSAVGRPNTKISCGAPSHPAPSASARCSAAPSVMHRDYCRSVCSAGHWKHSS